MLYNIIFKVYNCARLAVVAAAVTAALLGCEKMTVAPAEEDSQEANVTLHFGIYQQQDFAGTRSAETLTDQCSKLSVAIFRSDGTKAKSVLQNIDQDDFGTVAVSLAEGTYTVVAVAHNGLGTATVTSPEKVTFTSNKVTDTFVYCGSLTIGGSTTEQTMQMERRVAMVRLTLTDEQLPEDVDRLKFYYTGGSSTLNPSTGYGCVQSKQTEYRSCKDGGGETVRTYDLYTLPHEESDVLKLTITALDSDDNELYQYVMDGIPVTRNKITSWTGVLFGGSGGTMSQGGISITLDTSWDGTITYNF